MPTDTPFDFEMLHLLATTCPDPATIDWRAEYARLYDDAEKVEAALRNEVMSLHAEVDRLQPPPDIAQPLLDCAKRLADLTESSVSIDCEVWHTYDGPDRRRESTEYRVWFTATQTNYRDATLQGMETTSRKAWGNANPPVPVPEIVGEPTPAEPPAHMDF